MQKNLKRASAMILSLAMAVQFGLTDSYYIKANDEQPVEETKQENEASKSNVKDKDASNEDSANTPIAEEKTTDEKSDAEEAMTNSDETATSFSMMLAENANDTYKVELRSQNNSPLETVSLNVGKITDNFEGGKITLEGKTYSFVEARVIKKSNPTDYTPISYVAVYNGVTYYSTNSITGSPLEVEAGESIVVILKEDVTQYTVNYKLIVDGVEKTANISDYITLEGNETSVDTGTSFSFLVKPNKGFTVASVKQDNTELTAEGTKYSTNSITANTTVTIALNEKKKASIRLNGSNTTFVYNGETRDSTSNGKGWAIDQQFETNTNSLSFDLIGRLQYIQEHDRELNKVAVSLHDGSTYSLSKKSINIPTAPGQSVETQLTDDLKAIVTKGNEKISIGNGAYSYRYSVTFSSKNNIYDDIDISTNFKDATASELFVTSTVGVSTITCEKPNGIQILDPAKSDSNFLGLTPDEKYTFKFSVLSGYIPDASKISVEGTVDGKTLDKVTVTKQTNGSFSFEITADQDKYDYRIQVVATKSQYKLAYLDDETVIDSSSKLNAGEQATITSKKPRKDGYVFNGWTIEGDPSGTIYSSKEVVNIDDLIAYSSWDATDGVSKITFEPKWLKADEAKSVGYTILVHFDDDTPDREYDARTAPNKSVKVFKNELEASLKIDPDKYYLDSDQAFDRNNVKDGEVIEITYRTRKKLEVGTLSSVPYKGSEQKLVPTVSAEDNSSLVKDTDYTVSYSDGDYTNVTGKNLTVTITGIGKYKGTYPVSYQIIKCPVTLKSASLEKVYDGTALVNGDTALETEEGWVKGEGATYNFTGTQTNAGSSKNAFTYTLKDNTKEGNYSITKKEGTLTVTQQSIVPDPEHPETYKGITISNPKDKVYNGKDQTWVPEVKDAKGKVLDSSCYTVTYDKDDRTNVTGKINVTIKGAKDYKGEVTKTYQIIKCPVTLKSASLEKVYDGTALVNGDTALETEEGWVKGEGATYNFTGTQTNAGSSKNAFTYTLKDNTKEGNYSITKKEGTLTVTQQSIVPDPEHPETYKGITISNPKDKVYNGKDQTWVPEVKDAKGKVLDSSCYTVTYDKDDRTNVTGKINVTIKGAKDYKGEVTKTYQIIKCPVTLKSASLEKVYDGTALVNGDTALETEEGWVKGEGATYNFTGTQTNAGSSKNAFTYTLKDNTKEGNYSITKKEGTLTVTPKSIVPDGTDTPEEKKTGITVTKPSDSKYDGEEHKNKPTVTDTKTDKVLVEGKDYELSYSKDVTNAGTVTVTVTGKGNYEGSFEVTYQITKRLVTLKSADLEKVYDGTALVNGDTALETEEGWVEGEGATYNFTGTQTQAGNSPNAFTYTLKNNTKEGNYSITKKVGTLTVTPKSIVPDGPDTPEDEKTGITVTVPEGSKYDGEKHKNKPTVTDTKTDKVLVEGKDYELSYSKDVTNAGTVTVTVTGKGNYEGSFEVTYEITKRNVTLTSADASKTYDGKALTNTSITVSGDGFVEGEGAEYKVTGTQTQVGNSANEFEYTLNENTLASNYDITKVVGTLTVTAAPAPETPEKPSKQEKPAKPGKVKTGLQTNTGILMVAGTLALVGLGVCVVLARRKRY